MKKLFALLNETLKRGEDAVLVTVVASSGSTPRGAGARMLITHKGRLRGTIGGGAVEFKCEELAQEVLKNQNSRQEQFQLHPNQVADLGMICGGDVSVYFHYIPAGDSKVSQLTEQIARLYEADEQSWLILDISEGGNGDLAVFGVESGSQGFQVPDELIHTLSNSPAQCHVGCRTYYCERLVQAGRVFIFGGGHVAQELVPALARVNFRCIVLEDRKEFSRMELFEGVKETKLVNMENLSEVCECITEDDYVCIMTRGHKDDFRVQKQILKTTASYIGVIGSARKTASVFAKLKEEGYTDIDLSRITTPIGLNILAETPAEIAVSIAGQLIMKRAEKAKAFI